MKKLACEIVTIDVCIATYKRPGALSSLLHAIERLDLNGIQLRVIVVDNDRHRSAEKAACAFYQSQRFDFVYDVEPEQNIALARNRCLSHVESSYVAFIDDDEFPSENWLWSLLSCMLKYRCDIVFGPVFKLLPERAPSWAKRCFETARRETGQAVEFGGAGNVMMATHILEGETKRFNPSFGLTGGEDTDFFYRQFLDGRSLIWCDEAVVTEPVPAARLTLRWVWQRGFRSGQIFNRVFVSRYTAMRKCLWFGTKVTQVLIGIAAATLLRLFSYPSCIAMTVRVAAASGQLSRFFNGGDFEEYSDPNVR